MSDPGASVPETSYRAWTRSEGVDIVQTQYIPDLRCVELKPWKRTGGSACFINHEQSDRSNDCRVEEFRAGETSQPQRHLHEQMLYVLSGRGATKVWQSSGGEQVFEWHEGSLFAIPLNSWYQHFNGSGEQPVRLLAVTNAPVVMNMFADPEFVYHCDYEFLSRFDGRDAYFNGEGRLDGRYWETNFVPDVRQFKLLDYAERGAGGKNIQLKLAHNTLGAHISEFPVGTYKKGHKHGPGAHVLILSGTGYSLMWKQGQPFQRYDWSEGSLVIPPDDTFHQHFNSGPVAARYLALRYETRARDPQTGLPMSTISTRMGGDQIDYEDEDPQVREMYEEQCARHGVASKMDDFFRSAS
jgi:quercetin dioxygenase-like cupin family protein